MAQFLFLSLENPASSASSIAFNSQEYQKSTDEEVSFEYSYDRISSTNLKVRTALHVSVIDSGSESVDAKLEQTTLYSRTTRKQPRKMQSQGGRLEELVANERTSKSCEL